MGCVESIHGALRVQHKHETPELKKPQAAAVQSLRQNSDLDKTEASFKEYTLEVLREATNGFSSGNLLSERGDKVSNSVYRGRIVDEGRYVAVKRFSPGAWPDPRGFMEEASRVAKVRHERLVCLIGCCCESGERILVAEYMPNETLVQHLFNWEKYPMQWDLRITVALYVIRALNHCAENGFPIYHDLSTCRVLFDQDRLPRLSCFGLMKNSRQGMSYSSNLAYLPPEYIETGCVRPESVIFSYGTLLIDLLSGKRIPPTHALDLIRAKNFASLMDSCLEAQFSDADGAELVRIAAMCLQAEPGERPSGKMLATSMASLQRRMSTETRPSDVRNVTDVLSPLKLTALGDVCSRCDLTAMHEMLVKAGYKDDESSDNELSFQVWIKMQEMLTSRTRGDAAFRDKDFQAAITHYTDFIATETVTSATVYVRRALAYLFADQPQAALGDAMKAEIVSTKWPTAFYIQALALSKMGMDADAKDMLKEGTLLEMKQKRKSASNKP